MDAKCAKIYLPARKINAYIKDAGAMIPSLSHSAAKSDKYQQNTTKHPALKMVNIDAEIYVFFASIIFLLSHREAFS